MSSITITNQEQDSNPSNEYIDFKVTCTEDGSEVWFKMKRYAKLRKLMKVYNERQCIHPEAAGYAFLYNGTIIYRRQTPDELEMNDGDEICAFMLKHQYPSRERAYALREKLMKQLDSVNAFILGL